ncbi:unnamed protein product [Haemonchus placei]|uniref:Ubiquitin-like domain-containing protein n=1 Tax=Haemonchus placei TaxID=6290 RepID=A0A0N4W5Q5_HAEPC|nr:unnamed protein product [Haemonchus placei]
MSTCCPTDVCGEHNSAFESEDQPWSVTYTPVNEKPITFRIYRGEPVEFEVTYKDKDELYEAVKQKLIEIGAPDGKLYAIYYPIDYSLIENADDLVYAIQPEKPLKLFTTAAEGDVTSTGSSSDSSPEDGGSTGRRHRRHRRRSSRHHRPKHCPTYYSSFPCMSQFSPNQHYGCRGGFCHYGPPPCHMSQWGHCYC